MNKRLLFLFHSMGYMSIQIIQQLESIAQQRPRKCFFLHESDTWFVMCVFPSIFFFLCRIDLRKKKKKKFSTFVIRIAPQEQEKNGCQWHQTSAIDHLVSVCDISFFSGFASLFNSKNGKKKLRKYLFLIRIGLASALFMDWTTELLPSESVFGIYSCHDRLKPNTPIDLHVPKIKKKLFLDSIYSHQDITEPDRDGRLAIM